MNYNAEPALSVDHLLASSLSFGFRFLFTNGRSPVHTSKAHSVMLPVVRSWPGT